MCVATAVVTLSSAALHTVPQHSATVSHFLTKVTKSEIIWALQGIMSHSSVRENSSTADLFHSLFSYSDIATQFKTQKDKNSYVVAYGLCLYFHDQLVSDVKKCAILQYYLMKF